MNYEKLMVTIKPKKGDVITVDLYHGDRGVGSPIFRFFEKFFNEWYDTRIEHDRELEEKYFGCEAIYTKKGAIEQAIETFEEIVLEGSKRTFTEREIDRLDIESAFE